jgi:hypothetical protein
VILLTEKNYGVVNTAPEKIKIMALKKRTLLQRKALACLLFIIAAMFFVIQQEQRSHNPHKHKLLKLANTLVANMQEIGRVIEQTAA